MDPCRRAGHANRLGRERQPSEHWISTRSTRAPSRSASRMARTRPGKPAPLPRSTTWRAPIGERKKLGAVKNMPGPHIGKSRRRNKVRHRLPASQQCDIARRGQPLFHVKHPSRPRTSSRPASNVNSRAAASPALRRLASSSVMAAGVMPSIRWAWPIVRGPNHGKFLPGLVGEARGRRRSRNRMEWRRPHLDGTPAMSAAWRST